MNLLLLLTALLTSLTGMIAGDRTVSPRAPVAAERAVAMVQAVAAIPAVAQAARPAFALPAVRDTNVPLTRGLVLIPALGLTPENRRE